MYDLVGPLEQLDNYDLAFCSIVVSLLSVPSLDVKYYIYLYMLCYYTLKKCASSSEVLPKVALGTDTRVCILKIYDISYLHIKIDR